MITNIRNKKVTLDSLNAPPIITMNTYFIKNIHKHSHFKNYTYICEIVENWINYWNEIFDLNLKLVKKNNTHRVILEWTLPKENGDNKNETIYFSYQTSRRHIYRHQNFKPFLKHINEKLKNEEKNWYLLPDEIRSEWQKLKEITAYQALKWSNAGFSPNDFEFFYIKHNLYFQDVYTLKQAGFSNEEIITFGKIYKHENMEFLKNIKQTWTNYTTPETIPPKIFKEWKQIWNKDLETMIEASKWYYSEFKILPEKAWKLYKLGFVKPQIAWIIYNKFNKNINKLKSFVNKIKKQYNYPEPEKLVTLLSYVCEESQ